LTYTGGTYRSTGIGTHDAGAGIVFGHNEISNVQNAFALHNSNNTTVEYNTIHNCHTGVRIETSAANCLIQYNDIRDNNYAMRCGDDMGTGNEAHFNNFVGNNGTDTGFPTYVGAVCNIHTTNILDATNNWWGSPSGPGVVGPGTGDNVSNYVNFSPWLMSAGGTQTTETETATGANAAASTAHASATATGGTGSTTVTVAEYAGNPGGAPSGFSALGKYMDVCVSNIGGVTQVEIRLYYTDAEVAALGINENSLQLFWWDGSAWVACSNSGVNTVSNYMWAIITSTTTPSLSQLVGTPLGGGTLFPSVTTQDATFVGRYFATLNMNYAMGNSTSVDVRFAYKKSTDTAWSYTAWVPETVDGTHAESLEDLYPGTTSTETQYDFKAQLKYGNTVIDGSTLAFFIPGPPSGCFIATAAYGTPTAEQINVLREFRDDVLLKSTVGSQFVSLYYQISPPIANFIAGHEVLRTLVRELLVDPIVRVVKATGDIWRN